MTDHTCQLLVKLSPAEDAAVRDKATRLGMSLRELVVAAVNAYEAQPSLHGHIDALYAEIGKLRREVIVATDQLSTRIASVEHQTRQPTFDDRIGGG